MRKKGIMPALLLTAVFIISFGLSACTPGTTLPTPPPITESVQEVEGGVRIDADGILYWNAAKNATGYKVSVNDNVMWNDDRGEAIVFTETQANVKQYLRNGTNTVRIRSIGKDADGQPTETAWKEFSVEYSPQQEVTAPKQVKDVHFDARTGVLSWTAPDGTGLKYEVKEKDGLVDKTISETSIDLIAQGLETGKPYEIAITTVDTDGRKSEPVTGTYTILQQQEEESYLEQVENNIKNKVIDFLESRLYKNIRNINIEKLDLRYNAQTLKSEMLFWFNADVSKGLNNWNRDFIYKIQLDKNYDLTNNEAIKRALVSASEELKEIPNNSFNEILNYEHINHNVVETLFSLPGQNCDSVLKALQGKKIEMEVVTSWSGGDLVINAIIDNKLVAISIRNTRYGAGWSVQTYCEEAKKGGSHISTSTRIKETFSENAKVYESMKSSSNP